MSLFPKPGHGYSGVGEVPDEDLDQKSETYTDLLIKQPQQIKNLYSINIDNREDTAA